MFETLVRKITDRILFFTGTQHYLTMQLDITNACNLKCIHCYHPHHKNNGALDQSGWEKILDQYDALTKKLRLKPAVTLCGGEPMISSLLSPILESLVSRWPKIPIDVLTNGTVIRTDLLSFFEKNGVGFQVSLDGPDPDRHNVIRGTGNFERAMRGIQLFLGRGLQVHLQAVLSSKTAPWISEFFDLAQNTQVTSLSFARFITEGFGESLFQSGRDRPLSPFELKAALTEIVIHSRRTEVPTGTNRPLFHLIDPQLGKHGMIGFQGLIVDYKGNLKVASRSSFILGNILEEGLETLFLHHPLMKDLRDGKIEECGECTHLSKCGGNRVAAYAAFRSFLAPDPGCWIVEEKKQRRVANV